MGAKDRNSNIVELAEFKRARKRHFLSEHASRLDEFFSQFVAIHFSINFDIFNKVYLHQKLFQNEMAWDYYDFREELGEAIRSVYGPIIWQQINQLNWFDPRLFTYDEAIERCTSKFILSGDEISDAGGWSY